MPAITIDEILEKVKELKAETADKDEVIAEQHRQISELEAKLSRAEARANELESETQNWKDAAGKTDELMEKLAAALG